MGKRLHPICGGMKEEVLRHAADFEAWKKFDASYIDLSMDHGNIRLALN